jgi:CheR methyltransferase-like protein
MIYMSQVLQKRILPLFHYALNPGGVLFLGSSETVGGFGDLFVPWTKNIAYIRESQLHHLCKLSSFHALNLKSNIIILRTGENRRNGSIYRKSASRCSCIGIRRLV